LLELGLVLGTPLRTLASRYECSVSALHSHRHNHLTAVQKAAILAARAPADVDLEALSRSESEGLLGAVVGQRARLTQQVELTMEAGDYGRSISAERAICENLNLTAKLLGQLVTRHQVTHSFLITPDYVALRRALVEALTPFPEALRAVGAALAKLEQNAAQGILENKQPLMLEATPC
jgi:hypothetical protein